VELFTDSFKPGSQIFLARWQTYPLLIAIATTTIMQIYWLNVALAKWPASIVVPTFRASCVGRWCCCCCWVLLLLQVLQAATAAASMLCSGPAFSFCWWATVPIVLLLRLLLPPLPPQLLPLNAAVVNAAA
jgi:hypothetical protein